MASQLIEGEATLLFYHILQSESYRETNKHLPQSDCPLKKTGIIQWNRSKCTEYSRCNNNSKNVKFV